MICRKGFVSSGTRRCLPAGIIPASQSDETYAICNERIYTSPTDRKALCSSSLSDALVVAAVVVVGHKGLDLCLQIARQVVVLQQDAV